MRFSPKDSTKMALPIVFMFIMMGLLAAIGATFFLIEKGRHDAILYVSIGYGLLGGIYIFLILTGFYYLLGIISKIRDEEKIKELQNDLNKLKKGEK